MKTIKTIFLFAFLLLFNIPNFSQVKDTLYYDKHWKETDRKNHQFYRLLPLDTIGKLSLIIDYYKNGKMQMQGYAITKNLEDFEGDVYWYDKKGLDDSFSSYDNNTNHSLTYYHHNGGLWKKVSYKNKKKDGTIKIYDSKNRFRYSNVYKEGKTINIDYFGRRSYKKDCYYTLQWFDSKYLAKKTHYSNRKIQKEEVYSKDGRLLQSYSKSDFINNKLKNGEYQKEVTENGFVVDFKTTRYKSFQNKVFNLDNIKYINITKNYNNFIKNYNSEQTEYIHLDLFYDKSKPEKLYRKLSRVEKNNIKKTNLISVKKIKKQKVADLLKAISKKQWDYVFKRKRYSYSKDSTQYKNIYKLYNDSFFLDLKLKYGDRRIGGFGSHYSKDNDNNEKWRVYESKLYTINVILLNGNRPILALSDKSDFEYFIIPLTDGSYQTDFRGSESKSMPLDKDVDLNIMNYSDTKKYYNISKRGNKSYIVNEFNEVLLNKPYDSIKRLKQFIIAHDSGDIDVYNSKLEKLSLKNCRFAYYDRTNLQVLSNNTAYFINALGDKTNRQEISYSFCGTVSRTYFNIMDSIKEKPLIRIHYGGMTRRSSYEKLILTNLVNKQDITFLNKKKMDGYTGNSGFVDGYVNRTQTLLVKDNNKFGLYSYSKNTSKLKAEEIPVKKEDNDITLLISRAKEQSFKIKAKELLPIEYDSIELRNPLIILKKNNKIGIYKDKKGLIYKSLGNINVNFMRYEKLDGEKGFIDINTFKDYPDQ